MKTIRLTSLEMQVLGALWRTPSASIREIQEAFSEPRPAYTTVQTTVYRLEKKGAVRRIKKIGNAHVFEAAIGRSRARHQFVSHVLALFGGRVQPMMAQLAEAGKLTRQDLKELEQIINDAERERQKKGRSR